MQLDYVYLPHADFFLSSFIILKSNQIKPIVLALLWRLVFMRFLVMLMGEVRRK